MEAIVELWCFPGLGTDGRIFHRLIQALPYNWRIRVFDLPEPLDKKESLKAYAKRIWEQGIIPRPENPVYVLGYSLGGLVAQELSHFLDCRALFLLATARSRAALPRYFDYLQRLPLHGLIPKGFTVRVLPWAAKLRGEFSEAEDLALLKTMLKARSALHFTWGRQAVIAWEGCAEPSCKVWQIHGTKDHIFPAKKARGAVLIPKGNHAIVLNQAEFIANWLKTCLSSPAPMD